VSRSDLVDKIYETGCCEWYKLFGIGWCMVDSLFYGTCLLQVEVQVDAWLIHGSSYWYRFFGAG